jgi:hypothetical protein
MWNDDVIVVEPKKIHNKTGLSQKKSPKLRDNEFVIWASL